MSADDGWVIRKNEAGKYVLQHYFASDEELPSIDSSRSNHFDTLEEACRQYAKYDNTEYPSEYGLRILI